MSWQESDLHDLADCVAAIRLEEHRLKQQIAYLRDLGCPWSVIAEWLGTSRQAAWERYRTR